MKKSAPILALLLLLLLLAWGAGLTQLRAGEWFVATNGAPGGPGTKERPWDITSALGGRQPIAPGDTLWIQPGAYKHPPKVGGMGFPVKLAGRPGAPIGVHAQPGARVTIDGGLDVQPPSTHLLIRDLEILVSEPRPPQPVPPDPTYRNVNRPWGGLNVYAGTECKFINLVIHDNSQGMSWWSGSTQSETYGCIFYDNGWAGTDRGHGHAIYTQNNAGRKLITDCIFTGGYGYSLHAYGSSRADVNNYVAEGNIAYRAGTFLIGGGKPSHGIQVVSNFLHGVNLQLGYSAPTNEDCAVLGNVVVNAALSINRFRQVRSEGNLVLAPASPRPAGSRLILRPNRYDPNRANLAVFNWENRSELALDLSAFLRPGERYRLMNPRDLFGSPVCEGVFSREPVRVPLAGEFAAFVLFRVASP